MALNVSNNVRNLQNGTVVEVLTVFGTDEDHDFDDIYDVVVARSEVSGTRSLTSNGRVYTFTNTNNNHTVISVAARIREERPGETLVTTVSNSANQDLFFQLWGTNAQSNDSEFNTDGTNINVGLERNGQLQGWVRVRNNCPNLYAFGSGNDGIRPFDKRTVTGNGSADKYFAIAGLSLGSFNTPNVGVPAYILEFTGNVTYSGSGSRFDVDINPSASSLNSHFTMAAIDNTVITGNSGNSRIGEFVHSQPGANMLLQPGSYLYVARTVQKQDYMNDSEADPLLGGERYLLPESYPVNFTQQTDSDLTFAIYPNGGGGSVGFGISNIVFNYPVAKIVPDGWGQSRNNQIAINDVDKYRTHFVVNSQGADRFPHGIGVRYVDGAAGQGRSAVMWMNGYTTRFQNAEGVAYDKGGIIRRRLAGVMQPGNNHWINTNNRGYVGDGYLDAGLDYANHQFDYYPWEWSPQRRKNGFVLAYFLSPPAVTGDSLAAGTLRADQTSYTGNYDTWLITPGAQAQKLTLTPYTGTAIDQNRSLVFTGNRWANYDSDTGLSYAISTTDVSSNIVYPPSYLNVAFRSLGSSNITHLVNALLQIPYERVREWGQASEGTKRVVTDRLSAVSNVGEYHGLTNVHDANLVTPSGTTAILSGFGTGALGNFNCNVHTQIPSDNNIQVLQIANGQGFFSIQTATWESSSVDLRGFYFHHQATGSIPTPANAQMQGNRSLAQGCSILLQDDTTLYYRFNDCAIATGETFTVSVTGGNANSRLLLLDVPSGLAIGEPARISIAQSITLNANSAGTITLIDSDDGSVVVSTADTTSITQDVTGLGTRFIGVVSGRTCTDARIHIDTALGSTFTLPNAFVAYDQTAFSSALVANNIYDSDSEKLTVEISNARGGNAPSTAGTNNFFRTRILGTVPYNRLLASDGKLGTIGVDTAAVASVDGRFVEFIPGQNTDQQLGYVAAQNTTPFTREVNGFVVNFAVDPPVGLTIAQVTAALQDFGVATDSDVSVAQLELTAGHQAIQSDIANLSNKVDSETVTLLAAAGNDSELLASIDSDRAFYASRFDTIDAAHATIRDRQDSDRMMILAEMASDSDQNADLIANVQVDVGELIVDNSAVLSRLDSDLAVILGELSNDSDSVSARLFQIDSDLLLIRNDLIHDSDSVSNQTGDILTRLINHNNDFFNQFLSSNIPVGGIRDLVNRSNTQLVADTTPGTVKYRIVQIENAVNALSGVDSDTLNSLAALLTELDSDINTFRSVEHTGLTNVVTNIQNNVNNITPRITSVQDSIDSDLVPVLARTADTIDSDRPSTTDLTRARNIILGRISSI